MGTQYDLKSLSDSELETKLAEIRWDSPHFNALVQEQQRRQLTFLAKPHWVIWATLVFGVISAIAAVVGVAIMIYRGP